MLEALVSKKRLEKLVENCKLINVKLVVRWLDLYEFCWKARDFADISRRLLVKLSVRLSYNNWCVNSYKRSGFMVDEVISNK